MKQQLSNQTKNIRNTKMHKFIYLFFFVSLFIIGCTDESNFLSPVDSTSNQVNNQVSVTEPNWIGLPASEDLRLKKDVSVNKVIYGDQESLLEINTNYAGGPFGWISITANARFQRYSFDGVRHVYMTINDSFGEATFQPSGTFLKPVIYNLTIQGIDLSKVNPSTVKFVYMAPDGSYYQPKYEKLVVDKKAGKLQIMNAELPHFSRYGFIN